MKKKSILCLTYLLAGAFALMSVSELKLTAKAATEGVAECIMEAGSRRVLYEKRGDTRLPMASTTKICTAITVLDHVENLKEEIEIPDEAAGVEGSSVYLKSGEKYTVQDLLYGLMLRSGNDAATALALHFGGDIPRFSSMMNETAARSGALCSRFSNPHGLPSEDHYTTARDLSLITAYAMQNETFRKIVATKFYEPRGWANKNKMLTVYEGAIGVKTGYTRQAGRCLVSAAERNGMVLIATLLNCPTTYERTKELFDDCFDSYQFTPVLTAGEAVEVTFGNEKIRATVKESFSYPLLEAEKEYLEREIVASEMARRKPKKGEIIGEIQIFLAKRLLFSTNLYKL